MGNADLDLLLVSAVVQHRHSRRGAVWYDIHIVRRLVCQGRGHQAIGIAVVPRGLPVHPQPVHDVLLSAVHGEAVHPAGQDPLEPYQVGAVVLIVHHAALIHIVDGVIRRPAGPVEICLLPIVQIQERVGPYESALVVGGSPMILVPVNVVRIVDIARVLLVNVGRHPVHDLHCLLVIALVVQDIPQQTGRYGQGTVDTGVLRLVVGPPPDASAQVIAPASLPHDVEMLHRHVQKLLVSGAVVSPRAGDGHPGDVIVVLVPGPVPSMLLLEPPEDFPDHFIISLIPGMLIGVDHHLVHLRRLPE